MFKGYCHIRMEDSQFRDAKLMPEAATKRGKAGAAISLESLPASLLFSHLLTSFLILLNSHFSPHVQASDPIHIQLRSSIMEEHPEHWRHTLMGWDFWQDAKQYEDKISKELDIGKVNH